MKRDPIEQTPEFEAAMKKVQPTLDKLNSEIGNGMGNCYTYWNTKKELLREVGVDWQTPEEMNPEILFD